MIRELTSPSNPLLKSLRRALARGVTTEGWLAVEGPHLVEEALRATASASVRRVVVGRRAAQNFQHLLSRSPSEAEIIRVPDRLFEKLAQTETPQGVVALVEKYPADLESHLNRRDCLLLVACGIQNPGNLGTIIRSAQALGATAVITLEGTVSPFNPKAVRSSAGAIFHLPVFPDFESEKLFRRFRAVGLRTIAADQRSPMPLSSADLTTPVAILIGREASGLPPEISREAGQLLSIPIGLGTDSLNAAIAASIFLYEAARQRGFRY